MKVAIQGSRASKSGRTVVDLTMYNDNGIVMGLTACQNRATQNFIVYMKRRADEIEKYMKINHPWTNRTGRAERGLYTTVEDYSNGNNSTVSIGMYHRETTWYWRHLEYGMGRRFAIIEPTQRYFGPRLLDELNLSELYRFSGNPKR